jgi:hypothetical protein
MVLSASAVAGPAFTPGSADATTCLVWSIDVVSPVYRAPVGRTREEPHERG